MLKKSRGVYTEMQLRRCAEMSGAYGKEINQVLSMTAMHKEHQSGNRQNTVLQKDVIVFTQMFASDGLLSYIPGRSHKGVKEFSTSLKKPALMSKRLRALSRDMDMWKRLQHIPDEAQVNSN
jgi:hypothetical protein